MAKMNEYGPALVVLATIGLVLVIGPGVVKELTHVHTQTRIVQARAGLEQNPVLESLNRAHRDIATIVEPSVVYISTLRVDFGSSQPLRRLSSGSGWIYDDLGHIVTNEHVIRDAERIEVQLHNGTTREGTIVGTDPETDIAVIRIDPTHIIPARRGDTREVRQGDVVFAFGSPFDFRFSMSSGIVSGLGRAAAISRNENFIQTDAAINPGNSGGPLTNTRGEVIGMNTAIATGRPGNNSSEGVFSGIGLAIPVDMIELIVRQIITNQEVIKSIIGIQHPNTDEQNAQLLRTHGYQGRGVLVTTIYADSPAQEAGLEIRDVITTVNGQPVDGLRQLRALISSREPGETIRLGVWRDNRVGGTRFEADVTLIRRDAVDATLQSFEAMLSRVYGFQQFATSTEEKAAALGVDHRPGVLIWRISPRSQIDGVVPVGSIIIAVDETPVRNVREFLQRLIELPVHRYNIRIVKPDGTTEAIRLGR